MRCNSLSEQYIFITEMFQLVFDGRSGENVKIVKETAEIDDSCSSWKHESLHRVCAFIVWPFGGEWQLPPRELQRSTLVSLTSNFALQRARKSQVK